MSFFRRKKNTDQNTGQNKNKKSTEPNSFMKGLRKTSNALAGKMSRLFTGRNAIDDELYEELEEILIGADVGVATTMELISLLQDEVKEQKITEPNQLQPLLSTLIRNMFTNKQEKSMISSDGLTVLLFVGVNGVGKTTSIGKLAHRFKDNGKKVILAAGDTFRAGAIDQLEIWGERAEVDVIKHQFGSDPAAVIYDGIQAAKARKADILLCDTAGRLQNKVNLMEELKKVYRVIEREALSSKVFLVLDATTGQNALIQARKFQEAVNVSGVILTKLDGTAKGGIVIAIQNELNLQIEYVGLGEHPDDLQEFDVDQFLKALFQRETAHNNN